ncbi:MAG TPA: alanine racemase [Acidimicrobiales bacterium]
MRWYDLPTPALVVETVALAHNLATMAAARPADSLRPHVKAHKCTSLAREQATAGHRTFTCATPREVVGMAKAGLGDDLLLANEVLDPHRLAALSALDARVTVAVDSEATVLAAAEAGLREVVVDVEVGLPRCGCTPDDAGHIADLARGHGLAVRGVMGYEGHLMIVEDEGERAEKFAISMRRLARAFEDVGGEVVSSGGTGTYRLHSELGLANEVQAGSYALMDTAYARLGLPFQQALFVVASVVSVSPKGWVVCDAGLKSLGMDHGNPAIDGGDVWFCSDEHVTFSAREGEGLDKLRAGDRVRLLPAHIDPTVAMHEQVHLVDGDDVVDTWAVDLRGWDV